jgi:hypothetical protein
MNTNGMKNGSVLVTVLIATIVVGAICIRLAMLTLQEYRLSWRSADYSAALSAAESGIDLACEQFSQQLAGESVWSDWSSSGSTTYSLINTNGVNFTVMAELDGDFCTITATGKVDRIGGAIQRVIQATIKESKFSYFKYGLGGKSGVTLSGQFTIDSFNSDDGPYDPSTAQENATVAALIEKDGAVDGSGQGEVLGNVSVVDGATVSTSGQFVVSGEISYDADQTIPDVTVPFTPSSDTAITKTKTIAVSDGGTVDVSASKISLSSKSVLTFSGSGTIRVYVEGDISLSGQSYIKVAPSPDADLKVEIYVDGSVSLSGQGVVNDADLASSFSIWGTENCTSVSVSGQGEFVGTIYAPYADVTLSGQGDITGAVLGDTITCSGQGDIHIDEALMGDSDVASGEKYTRIEWVEL